MIKIISILLLTLSGFSAFGCNEPTLRTPVEIAKSVVGKSLLCNYNGVESDGAINVSYPRCIGGSPLVTLKAFDTTVIVSELSEVGDKLTVVTESADFGISCVVTEVEK